MAPYTLAACLPASRHAGSQRRSRRSAAFGLSAGALAVSGYALVQSLAANRGYVVLRHFG